MSSLNPLASALDRNDEVPKQTLAKEIAEAADKAAVRERVTNSSNKDRAIQSDCIKVLYEIGALKPDIGTDDRNDIVRVLQKLTA